jgi:gluconolactonase
VPTAEVVADSVPFGEGPVWCADGTLVCTSVTHGALLRVDVDAGAVHHVATTRGGANAAAAAQDGASLVTQNGGLDLVSTGHRPSAPPVLWHRPGLQLVTADGTVTDLIEEPLQAPNDLVVGADGTVWFTDPGPFDPQTGIARVLALRPDGTLDVVSDGHSYTNGIALDPDGETLVVVVDDKTLVRMRGAERELAVRHIGDTAGDGFCLDADGRYYVATKRGNGIRVFDPDGSEVDFLDAPAGPGFVTNCCFGGAEGRTLFATDAGRDTVLAWQHLPTPGLPLHVWPIPSHLTRSTA